MVKTYIVHAEVTDIYNQLPPIDITTEIQAEDKFNAAATAQFLSDQGAMLYIISIKEK